MKMRKKLSVKVPKVHGPRTHKTHSAAPRLRLRHLSPMGHPSDAGGMAFPSSGTPASGSGMAFPVAAGASAAAPPPDGGAPAPVPPGL